MMEKVEAAYPSECMTDPTHRGFVTDGTGMLLCAVCGGACETDYSLATPGPR